MSQAAKEKDKQRNCGNPLLCEWLEEWMEQAQSIHSKAYYTYKKAYTSMMAHPLPFHHPSEADQLPGIGKGLAKKLEQRLIQHCKDNDLPIPTRVNGRKRGFEQIDTSSTADEAATQSSQPARAKRKPTTYVPRYRSGGYAIMLALYNREQRDQNNVRMSREEIVAEAQPFCDSSFEATDMGKSYTAWASIKTLLEKGYVWKQSSPSRYSLTDTGKAMGEKLAQVSAERGNLLSSNSQPESSQPATPAGAAPVSISSQTSHNNHSRLPPPTTNNTIKPTALVKTDDSLDIQLRVSRVIASGVLSAERERELLNLMHKATAEDPTEATAPGPSSSVNTTSVSLPSRPSQPESSATTAAAETYVILSSDEDEDEQDLTNDRSIVIPPRQTSGNKGELNDTNGPATFKMFWYSYLNTDNCAVSKASEAAVHIDETSCRMSYRIKYHTSQETSPFMINVKTDKPTNDGFAIGYLKEHVADRACPGLGPYSASAADKETVDLHVPSPRSASPDFDLEFDVNALHDDWWTQEVCSQLSLEPEQGPSEQRSNAAQTLDQLSQVSDVSDFPQFNSQSLSQVDPTTTLSQVAAATRDFDSVQCRSFPPGSFEVMLVLDSREVRSRRDRDYIRDMLQKRGINVDVRSLDLGDVMWVAQKTTDDGPVEELFLDIVLERKRMDDLVSSIKDGRFKEQKHRLKRAAAKQVFYLIEELNMDEAVRFGQQAVRTALASTQVIDGFFVKHTTSMDDTIDYLERLTKSLKKEYEPQTLYQIPASAVDKADYMAMKQHFRTRYPQRNYLISSGLFGRLNSKYGTLTLEDMFAKLLMNIRGVSAEKAYELKRLYLTPHLLMKAYDDCDKILDEKNLAKEATKSSLPRRRWGPSLSHKLWEVWRSQQYS